MKALFIGGTGTISGAISRLAIARGWELYLLNRGSRPLPEGARQIHADIADEDDVRAKLSGMYFDVVADFIAFTPDQVERELIYRTLIELKSDLTEIKGMLRDFNLQGALGEPPKLMEVIPVQPGGDITLEEMERQAVIDALRQTRGNRRKAARLLGIGERTLYRKLKQHDIHES